ncbi:MAG: tetratricopeptide repeat protein [Candidatus Aureabacteria bacterium]|nr:tetratricopeptide repeat protein [Candidatus Auribacterota bacterium]
MLHKKDDILKHSLSFLFWVLLVSFCIHKVFNFDIWWHLKTGETICRSLSVPRKDIFTYTVSGNEWIDLHWIFQVISFGLYTAFGFVGLTIFVTIIMTATFLLVKRLAGKDVSPAIVFAVLFFGVMIMESRFFIRPEVLSYLYLLIFLNVLKNREKLGKKKTTLFLALSQLLWVNTQGLFILGIVLVFCFFTEKSVHALLSSKGRENIFFAGKVLLALIAVSCLNPYGVKGLLFPLKLFTRIGPEENLFRLNIKEFISPFASSGYGLYKGYAFLTVMLIIMFFRTYPLHHVLFAVLMLFLSLQANRNINLFVLSSLPIVINGAGQLYAKGLSWKRDSMARGAKFINAALEIFLICVFLFMIIQVTSNRYYIRNSSMKRFGLGVNHLFYPEGIVRFIIEKDIRGKIFNDIGTGSYAIYYFYPERKVFIDGRLEVMGDEHFNRFIKVLSDVKILEDFIRKEDFDIILFRFEPGAERVVSFLSHLKGWRLVFFSHSGFVLLKEGTREDLGTVLDEKLANLEEDIRQRAGEINLSQSYFARDPTEHYLYGKILSCFGYNHLAGLYLTEAIKVNPGLFFIHRSAGDVYFSLGNMNAAEVFYQNACQLNPRDVLSLLGLARISMKQERYSEALAYIQKALKIKRRDTTLLFYKGLLDFYLKDYDSAFLAFQKITSLSSVKNLRAISFYNMGICREKTGKEKEAEELFRKAFSMDETLQKSTQGLDDKVILD